MSATQTWHDLYSKLLAQLHERSPALPEDPSDTELSAAIDDLEDDGADKWFPNPDQGLRLERPIQAFVGPREILEWARAEGPLSGNRT